LIRSLSPPVEKVSIALSTFSAVKIERWFSGFPMRPIVGRDDEGNELDEKARLRDGNDDEKGVP
jgi:hypothetical protein